MSVNPALSDSFGFAVVISMAVRARLSSCVDVSLCVRVILSLFRRNGRRHKLQGEPHRETNQIIVLWMDDQTTSEAKDTLGDDLLKALKDIQDRDSSKSEENRTAAVWEDPRTRNSPFMHVDAFPWCRSVRIRIVRLRAHDAERCQSFSDEWRIGKGGTRAKNNKAQKTFNAACSFSCLAPSLSLSLSS